MTTTPDRPAETAATLDAKFAAWQATGRPLAALDPAPGSDPDGHDHTRCCRACQWHTTPHMGCLMR